MEFKTVRTYLRQDLNSAMSAFKKDPSCARFILLNSAMLAYQWMEKQEFQSEEDALIRAYENGGIHAVADVVKGQCIFS